MQLIGVAPTDTSVLARTGEIYDNEGDKSQAFQYYYDVSGGEVWIADYSDTITVYITEWRILILEWLINEILFLLFKIHICLTNFSEQLMLRTIYNLCKVVKVPVLSPRYWVHKFE